MEERQTEPTLRQILENLIDELVVTGILWEEALAEFEKLFILRVLRSTQGNVGKAAETMGIHRNTLSKKIREYEIDRKNLC